MRSVLCLMVVFSGLQSASGETPLEVAKSLGNGKYKNWTYGSNMREQQIDCVQFLVAVLEEALGQRLDAATRKQVLISGLSPEELMKLPELIQADDPRIRGVQQALIDLKKGKAVSPQDAQPGDLIQYWMQRKDETWYGHSAVIETVERQGDHVLATLYGSHKSSNGVASSNYKLQLNGPRRKVYLVRLAP